MGQKAKKEKVKLHGRKSVASSDAAAEARSETRPKPTLLAYPPSSVAEHQLLRRRVVIYADGGARGNPGPAAIGVVIGDKRYGERIGETTNNVAEYRAMIFALKKVKQLLGKKQAATSSLEIRSDSELVVRQMNGRYKVKEKSLSPLFIELWNAKQDFAEVLFKEVSREENSIADRLVNEALDGRGETRALFY